MNYSEQIHDYLDGILDHSDEADLLTAIAQSTELRDELRHAIALKAAFKTDVQALTPPPHLTSSIFANLGFAPPAAPMQTASIQAASAQVVVKEAVHANSGNAVLTGMVSSLLTAILLLSWNMFATQGSKQQSGIASVFAERDSPNLSSLMYLRVAPSPTAAFRTQLPYTQAFMRQTATKQLPVRPAMTSMLAFGQSSSSGLPSGAATEQAPPQNVVSENTLSANNLYTLNAAPHLAFMPANNVSAPENFAPNPIQNSVSNTLLSEETSWLQRVQIQARRIGATSIPPTDFPSNPSSFLRNTALSVMVKLSERDSERHSVGLECSEETFFQRFQEYRVGEGDAPVTIQQNPSLFWAGISYRYALVPPPEQGFTPFVQGLVGATALGATGRAMLGLNYSPDAKTEFTLGVETSTLLFLHQGVLYAAPKLGFSYGVSLRF